MKKIHFISIGIVLIILDQLSKLWIVSNISLGEVKSFLPGVFSLTYLRNYGAAFSILQNQQWFFFVITIAFLGVATRFFIKSKDHQIITRIGLLLILSGGIGNFIDRLRLGYVVDMIQLDFMDFAIFNLADSYLTVGVLVLVLALWKEN
ncbi:signal peptidase II [Streptococcus sp. CSL10205-OR2]|uniref:signal peptidase II n=1 Tax=Streptococcus sp. CSL10205-OR2 TaxID=2980558 RepID=UPI0021D8E536|nr:signal peptidase II [Streptococcus sp. CSL10205-OR2]MCU9534357.1 signal peptidase II [Streptococcus sp. CSL10205-OR2]